MKERFLILYATGIVPVMIGCFYFFSRLNEKSIGYFVPYVIYLLLLLAGIMIFFEKKQEHTVTIPKNEIVYDIVAFIPVIATFFVAFLPTASHMTGKLFWITAVYALINGTLEELFWRFTFNRVYKGKVLFAYIIPTIIFTSWHFALTFAYGVSYHGGTLALVGGAGVMGAIWGLVIYRTQNIKITMIAHIFANFFAFSQLLYQNFFAGTLVK